MPVLRARIGGVWVDVGGGSGGDGADEVFIGPDTPTDASTELWVDTDEADTTDPNVARWNSAWGVVVPPSVVSSLVGPIGTTWTTVVSVTSTLVSGRRYRVLSVGYGGGNGGTYYRMRILQDGATGIGTTAIAYAQPNGTALLDAEAFVVGDGGAHSFAMQVLTDANTVMINPGAFISVEDIGPVSVASNPPAAPASVWTNLTLLNGYTHRSGSPGQYRLLGDMVQFRGRIIGTVTASPLFIMPVGFRPVSGPVVSLATIVSGAWAHGLLYIDPSGEAQMQSNGHSELTLNEVTYSVAA